MFAAIYFGQIAFAALPYVPVEPPPPPPAPPVVYCSKYAVGVCIGEDNHVAPIGSPVGTAGKRGGLTRVVGSQNRRGGLGVAIGTKGGPVRPDECC